MLVLDTTDARADILSWRETGRPSLTSPLISQKHPRRPTGESVTLGFSRAFVTHPAAPWFGLFACQYKRRQLTSRNTRTTRRLQQFEDVWIAGEAAQDLADFRSKVTGRSSVREDGDLTVGQTRTGAIVLRSTCV